MSLLTQNDLDDAVRRACLLHKHKQELLVAFIRDIARNNSPEGIKAKKKLKEWNLDADK